MNFCKECDKYISLYLDELLDDKSKVEFLKHIEGCSQCSAKLKEASYVADLCREDQDIELPENFSASLHKRLLETSTKESKSKFVFFMNNKKLIASLSSAAILVVSLLAYNLLPHVGSSKDSTSFANETAQVKASSSENGYSGSSEAKSSTTDNTTVAAKADSNAKTKDVDMTITYREGVSSEDADISIKSKKEVSPEQTKNSEQARIYQDKPVASTNDEESKKEQQIDAFCYTLSLENQADNNKYYSNYAQINSQIPPQSIEIEVLRKFMKEIGSIELKPVTINSVVGNSVEAIDGAQADTSKTSSAQTPQVDSQYIDYYLPLSLYSTLESKAVKYKLDLSNKTVITKNDITESYKVLNTQIGEIDNKILEASKKNENTSALEAEKAKLTEELNKIIVEKEMITVRIFY